MSQVIWKFNLEREVMQTIEMPKGAEILSIGSQETFGGLSQICIWAKVDPSAEKEKRTFAMYVTGHEMIDGKQKFLGRITFQVFEFHLFEWEKSS